MTASQPAQPKPSPGLWHSIQIMFHKHAQPGVGREQYTTGHLNVTDALTEIHHWADDNGVDPAAPVDAATGLPPDAYAEQGSPAAPSDPAATPAPAAGAPSGPAGAAQPALDELAAGDDQPG
jgi:hypothetical protein